MNILITGGCGFVGSNLAYYFKEAGHDVTCVDNLVRRGSEYNLPEFKQRSIRFVHGDIRCVEDFPKPDFDFLLECSAQPSATGGYDNPVFDFTNNTVGLMNCLEYCRKNDIALMFWSTNKVYCGDKINAIPRIEKETRYEWADYNGVSENFSVDGGDHSIYGLTKIQSDLAVQEYADAFGVRTVVNRFSCLAGPRQFGKCAQGWVSWFVVAVHLGLPIEFIGWKGKQVRDILFAGDICSLIEMEMENIDKISGQVFNVGGGQKNSRSLIEAVSDIFTVTGIKLEVRMAAEARKADHAVYITDTSKARMMLGWEPKIDVLPGLHEISEWVKDNIEILRRMYSISL